MRTTWRRSTYAREVAFERNPDVIATALEAETVLLDPSTRAMFTLNGAGSIVWREIEHGLDHLVSMITARYSVSAEQARSDAEQVVKDLADAGLLQLIDS